jgi:hypothetical protein
MSPNAKRVKVHAEITHKQSNLVLELVTHPQWVDGRGGRADGWVGGWVGEWVGGSMPQGTGRALGKNNTTFSKGPSCSCPLEVKGPLGATLDMKNDNATRYIGGPNRRLL